MRRRFFLIFNPTAGTSKRAVVATVVGHLRQAGGLVVWSSAVTAEAAYAAAHVAARGGAFDCVLVAGGDGTIRQVAAAVANTVTTLGVVPLGTGNVLAHELGLPRTPQAIADLLLHGATVTAELGLANGAPFLLMAGVGFDGRVIAGLDHGLKNRVAKLAYVSPMLAALRRPLDRLTVTIDGNETRANWAVIANAERYGGAFRMAPSTHVTKPGFVAVLFQAKSKWRHVGHLTALSIGSLGILARQAQSVSMVPCQKVEISSVEPVPAQLDGDAFVTTPLTITRGGGTVTIISPGKA